MRHIILLTGMCLLFSVSCTRDMNANSVNGLYTESSPIAGRSKLNFINKGIVIKSETGSASKDTFNYKIAGGKIILTATFSNMEYSQQFDFEQVDSRTLKIENLYPSIPENPKSFMIFKK